MARYRARVLEAGNPAEIARELERTDSDPEGVGIMTRKGRTLLVRVDGVSLKAAPLLKQELLALGADSSHARGVADHSVERSPVVLIATPGQYHRLLPKLRRQPFRLREVADAVEQALENYGRRAVRTIPTLHRPLTLGDRTRVMGVLNVTPDSFSDGGQFARPGAAVAHALAMADAGASVVDVGGESTRPGAGPVAASEELKRLEPVVRELHDRLAVPLSIDTRKPEVARAALDWGADLVNDISGLRDAEMRRVVARTGAPAVLVHLRGTPRTMQARTDYEDVRAEVYAALADRTTEAVADGIPADRLLVDPGLGFAKSHEQNLELLHRLGEFRSLGFPLVVGASRKAFLGHALGQAPVSGREDASVAAAVIAAMEGADLVRVHDVGPTVRALRLADAVRRERFDDSPPPP